MRVRDHILWNRRLRGQAPWLWNGQDNLILADDDNVSITAHVTCFTYRSSHT